MGKSRKKHPKKRTAAFKEKEPTELVEAPHSFIIHRGLSCPYITDLTIDFRKIMEPFTALNLKETKTNKIKDFVSMSSFFHVSYMGIFNKAATQLSFKVVRMPRGPTLTFKVHQFSLARDVLATSKRQFIDDEIFKHSPLIIMNNFTGEGKHLKLMASTFQNMFPAINLTQVNIATIRRCVLFSYTPDTNLVEMRHYSIQVVPVGLTRGVKKLIMGKIPNMTKCEDIADFIMQDGAASESEAEDDVNAQVILPQAIKRKGNLENNKSAVRLYEIGPRLTMQLMKIEEGLLNGEVLYHDHIIKSEEEKEKMRRMIEKKNKLKEQRKKVQEENRARNIKLKEAGQKRKYREANANKGDSEAEDDAEYYKQEVGEEPDEELFKGADHSRSKRTRLPAGMKFKNKKLKKEDGAKKSNNNFKYNNKKETINKTNKKFSKYKAKFS